MTLFSARFGYSQRASTGRFIFVRESRTGRPHTPHTSPQTTHWPPMSDPHALYRPSVRCSSEWALADGSDASGELTGLLLLCPLSEDVGECEEDHDSLRARERSSSAALSLTPVSTPSPSSAPPSPLKALAPELVVAFPHSSGAQLLSSVEVVSSSRICELYLACVSDSAPAHTFDYHSSVKAARTPISAGAALYRMHVRFEPPTLVSAFKLKLCSLAERNHLRAQRLALRGRFGYQHPDNVRAHEQRQRTSKQQQQNQLMMMMMGMMRPSSSAGSAPASASTRSLRAASDVASEGTSSSSSSSSSSSPSLTSGTSSPSLTSATSSSLSSSSLPAPRSGSASLSGGSSVARESSVSGETVVAASATGLSPGVDQLSAQLQCLLSEMRAFRGEVCDRLERIETRLDVMDRENTTQSTAPSAAAVRCASPGPGTVLGDDGSAG
jgi:hypothetical protein